MNDHVGEEDLDTAGASIQTFAPGGLWGLVAGGILALLALAAAALRRVWRRRSGR